MEKEHMDIKEALHEAYKIGNKAGENLTTYFFKLRIRWAFNDLRNTNFYNSLSEQDKRYIDACETYLNRGTLI